MVQRAMQDLTYSSLCFPEAIRARGMESAEDIPYYFYRDDGLRVWEAIRRYVGLGLGSPGTGPSRGRLGPGEEPGLDSGPTHTGQAGPRVPRLISHPLPASWARSWASTTRVTRWWQRTRSCRPLSRTSSCTACGAARHQVGAAPMVSSRVGSGGFRLAQGAHSPGFPKALRSREQLTEYLTMIIFTASAQHAAVNFGQVGRPDPDPPHLPRTLRWVPTGEEQGIGRGADPRGQSGAGARVGRRRPTAGLPGPMHVRAVRSMTGAPGSPMRRPP